jgi:hypothetical protein
MAPKAWATVGTNTEMLDAQAVNLLRRMVTAYLGGNEADQLKFAAKYRTTMAPAVVNMLRVIVPSLTKQGFRWHASPVPHQGTVPLFPVAFMRPSLTWSISAGQVTVELLTTTQHNPGNVGGATVVDAICGSMLVRRRSAWDGRSRHLAAPAFPSSLEALSWVSRAVDEVTANARAIDEEWEVNHARMAGRPSRTQG